MLQRSQYSDIHACWLQDSHFYYNLAITINCKEYGNVIAIYGYDVLQKSECSSYLHDPHTYPRFRNLRLTLSRTRPQIRTISSRRSRRQLFSFSSQWKSYKVTCPCPFCNFACIIQTGTFFLSKLPSEIMLHRVDKQSWYMQLWGSLHLWDRQALPKTAVNCLAPHSPAVILSVRFISSTTDLLQESIALHHC